MMEHDELDQLSAYIDGELDHAERARLESHLPTCAECRGTLDALRMTVADLRALPEPAPTEQDSWALRSAIARARRPVKRWQRSIVAAGSVAAIAIAFVAFQHSSAPKFSTTAKDITAGGTIPVVTLNTNFDKFSAQEHLLREAGIVPTAGSVQEGLSSDSSGTPAPAFPYRSGANSKAAPPADASQINRCVEVVQGSTQEYLEPYRYELASFEGTPAFVLIFKASDRYEMWIMSRAAGHVCDTLFFSQAG